MERSNPWRRMLARLALDRPELAGWAIYDWANSAVLTTVVAAVFPIFYSQVAGAEIGAAEAEWRFGLATTVSMALIAVLAPVLGAFADLSGAKRRFLFVFLAVGVAATGMMYFIQHGQWLFAAVLFVLTNVGASGSFVFYDALLPHVARSDEMDRLSTSAYALGYLGGGLLLALNLAWIQNPEWFGLPSGPDLTQEEKTLPTRLAFVSVALWWALFSIPLFRHVGEPPSRRGDRTRASAVSAALGQLRTTFADLRRLPQAFGLLIAFLLYNDGIGTIMRMAAIYGEKLQIPRADLIAAILLVQFIGVPCAMFFGWMAQRIGAKRAILIGIGVYFGISLLAYWMTTKTHFYVLAILVGFAQGGCQALSRSLFASMIPKDRSAEFFGLFSVLEKFAGIAGPALFALANRYSESGRLGTLVLILFFGSGALLLARVDVERGRRDVADVQG